MVKNFIEVTMSQYGCGCGSGAGPFSKGRDLVDFMYQAHGGAIRDQEILPGPIPTNCQGCGKPFFLHTYFGRCPSCGCVHAVAPMSPTAEKIQFAGKEYHLPA
jgi:hypothetical protein